MINNFGRDSITKRHSSFLLTCSIISGVSMLSAMNAYAEPPANSAGISVFLDVQASFPLGDDVETHAISLDGNFTSDEVRETSADELYGVTLGFIAPLNSFRYSSPDWSVGLTARFEQGDTDKSFAAGNMSMFPNTTGFPNLGGTVDIEERLALLDWEARYNVRSDESAISSQVWKFGLRAGYYSEETLIMNNPAIMRRFSKNTTNYLGAGAHIGTEFTVPVSECLAFDFSIGGGVLIGRKEALRRTSQTGVGISFLDEIDRTTAVPTIDASVSLHIQLAAHAAISIGVKAEALFGIRNEFLSNNATVARPFGFDENVTQYFISPFIRLSTKF